MTELVYGDKITRKYALRNSLGTPGLFCVIGDEVKNFKILE